jgi:6-phosphogluconolactonase
MTDPPSAAGTRTTPVRWIGVSDPTELHRAACRYILAAAARARDGRGRFLIVLAGGHTPRGAYRMLRDAHVDWRFWHVYFGDERCLAAKDAERNSRQAAEDWLDYVTIPRDQVHVIPAQQGADRAAAAYADTLRGVGDFDLVLLGLGEDGHTAGLFPGHAWNVAPAADVLAVFDAPKPPAERVSLSAARLSRAREVLFLVEGESKRSVVALWRAGEDLPAGSIRPAAGVDVLIESTLLGPQTSE